MYIKQTPSGGSVIWQETWLVLRYGIISWQDKIPWTERENNMRLVFLVYCVISLSLTISFSFSFFVFLSHLTLCLDTCRPPLLPVPSRPCSDSWPRLVVESHGCFRPLWDTCPLVLPCPPTTQRDRLCRPDVPHGVHLLSPFPSFLCLSWRPCSSSFTLFFFSYFWPF